MTKKKLSNRFTFLFLMFLLFVFRVSSMVEHSAVNRRVVGSNPTRGAKKSPKYGAFLFNKVVPNFKNEI